MTEKIAAIGREFLYAATTVSAHPHTSGCIFFFLVPINVDELTLLPCDAFASTSVQPSCISKDYCPSNLSFSVLYHQFLSSGSLLLALKKCYLFYNFKIKKLFLDSTYPFCYCLFSFSLLVAKPPERVSICSQFYFYCSLLQLLH